MEDNKQYKFYVREKWIYRGSIIKQDDVTYTIFDTSKQKEFVLPKANTIVEEIRE